MRTRLALVSALTVLATVTSAHAASKPGKNTKPTKVVTNPLSISPMSVKAGAKLHIHGVKFGVHKKVQIVVYCPMWKTGTKPTAKLSAKTDGNGKFSTTWKAVAPKKGHLCNVYALNLHGKTGAWDTVGFTVKK